MIVIVGLPISENEPEAVWLSTTIGIGTATGDIPHVAEAFTVKVDALWRKRENVRGTLSATLTEMYGYATEPNPDRDGWPGTEDGKV
jgi:hypothetical protein